MRPDSVGPGRKTGCRLGRAVGSTLVTPERRPWWSGEERRSETGEETTIGVFHCIDSSGPDTLTMGPIVWMGVDPPNEPGGFIRSDI